MAALSPAPMPGPRGTRWADRPANITNGELLTLRETIEQQSAAIDELMADVRMLRERSTRAEQDIEGHEVMLEQHDDRLDTLEFTAPCGAAPVPDTARPDPARIVVAEPIDPEGADAALAEYQRAFGLMLAGAALFRSLGVDPVDYLPAIERTLDAAQSLETQP